MAKQTTPKAPEKPAQSETPATTPQPPAPTPEPPKEARDLAQLGDFRPSELKQEEADQLPWECVKAMCIKPGDYIGRDDDVLRRRGFALLGKLRGEKPTLQRAVSPADIRATPGDPGLTPERAAVIAKTTGQMPFPQ